MCLSGVEVIHIRTVVDFEEIDKRTPQKHHDNTHAKNLHLGPRHVEHDEIHGYLLRGLDSNAPCS